MNKEEIKIVKLEFPEQPISDLLLGMNIHRAFTSLAVDWSTECVASLQHLLNTVSLESHSHIRAHSLKNTGNSPQQRKFSRAAKRSCQALFWKQLLNRGLKSQQV